MPSSSSAAILAFRRRLGGASLIAGALQGLLAVAVLLTVLLVVMRLYGGYLAPTGWWLLLAAPVVGWGAWCARRDAFGANSAAAHLDQRLGLEGLLLCAGEGQRLDPAWQAELDRRLYSLGGVLPRLRWRRILPFPLLAAACATLLACLPPPPEPIAQRPLPTYEAEVGRLDAELRDLFERGNVPDEVADELERRLRDLQRRVDAGDVPSFREFDELDQRITREQLMQLADEARGRGGAGDGDGSTESRARSMESLLAAASMLSRLGLLEKLEPMFAEALQAVRDADGSFRLDELPFDPAELQALAEAFGAAFGELDLGALGLDASALGDLEELLGALGQCDFGGGARSGAGVGRGGVNRGPGHAALSFTESVEGTAANALPLPPGRGLPNQWVPVGSERITPTVAPERSRQPGSAGAAGTGGASWQLEYAPRHRAVLRRYFREVGK